MAAETKVYTPMTPHPRLSSAAANLAKAVADVYEPFCRTTFKMAADAIADIMINRTNTKDWAQVSAILGAGLHPDALRVSYMGSEMSLLGLSAYKGEQMIAKTLINFEADPTRPVCEGRTQTAADYARMGGHEELAEWLRGCEKEWKARLDLQKSNIVDLIRQQYRV